jgi:hypothetical protein
MRTTVRTPGGAPARRRDRTRTPVPAVCITSARGALGGEHRVLATRARRGRSSRCARARGRRPASSARTAGSTSRSLRGVPGLGVVVCTGQSTVAQRVRGLRLGRGRLAHQACHPRSSCAESRVSSRRRRASRAASRRGHGGEIEIRRTLPGLRGGAPSDLTAASSSSSRLLASARAVWSARRSTSALWGYAMARGDAPWTSSCASCADASARRGWRYIPNPLQRSGTHSLLAARRKQALAGRGASRRPDFLPSEVFAATRPHALNGSQR